MCYRERFQLYKQVSICHHMFTWSNKTRRHSATFVKLITRPTIVVKRYLVFYLDPLRIGYETWNGEYT